MQHGVTLGYHPYKAELNASFIAPREHSLSRLRAWQAVFANRPLTPNFSWHFWTLATLGSQYLMLFTPGCLFHPFHICCPRIQLLKCTDACFSLDKDSVQRSGISVPSFGMSWNEFQCRLVSKGTSVKSWRTLHMIFRWGTKGHSSSSTRPYFSVWFLCPYYSSFFFSLLGLSSCCTGLVGHAGVALFRGSVGDFKLHARLLFIHQHLCR